MHICVCTWTFNLWRRCRSCDRYSPRPKDILWPKFQWRVRHLARYLNPMHGLFLGWSHAPLPWPAAMMWPATLINATLFHTLFRDEVPGEVLGWEISRFKYFLYVFIGMFHLDMDT